MGVFCCMCLRISSHRGSFIHFLLVCMRLDAALFFVVVTAHALTYKPFHVGVFGLTYVSACQWSCTCMFLNFRRLACTCMHKHFNATTSYGMFQDQDDKHLLLSFHFGTWRRWYTENAEDVSTNTNTSVAHTSTSILYSVSTHKYTPIWTYSKYNIVV